MLLTSGSAVILFLLCPGFFLKGQQVVFAEDFSGFTTGTHTTPSTSDASGNLDSRTAVPGWTGSKVYSAGGEIKLGTASLTGWIETPPVSLSEEALILKFDISRWPGDESTVQVYLNDLPLGNVITPTDDFQTSILSIPAETVTAKIRFAGLTKRFFLDNIRIEQGNVSSSFNNSGEVQEKPLIYPNPASDFIRIENTMDFNRMEIADISGKIVRIIDLSGRDNMVLSLESLPAGLYFIRFSSGKMICTSRLIIEKGR